MSNFLKIIFLGVLFFLVGCASVEAPKSTKEKVPPTSNPIPGLTFQNDINLKEVNAVKSNPNRFSKSFDFIEDWWIIKADENQEVSLKADGNEIDLKSADISLNFQGLFVDADISLSYSEVSGAFEFLYPLSAGSSVNSFVMTVGERKIRAIITSSKEAEAIYEQARKIGLKASVISKTALHDMLLKSHTLSKMPVKIDFSYSALARYKNDRHHFSLPKFSQSSKAKTTVSYKVKKGLFKEFRYQGYVLREKEEFQKFFVQDLSKPLNFSFELVGDQQIYISEYKGMTAYAIWYPKQQKLITEIDKDISKFTKGVKIDGRALISVAAYDLINNMIGSKRSAESISRQAIRYQILTGLTSQLVVDTQR